MGSIFPTPHKSYLHQLPETWGLRCRRRFRWRSVSPSARGPANLNFLRAAAWSSASSAPSLLRPGPSRSSSAHPACAPTTARSWADSESSVRNHALRARFPHRRLLVRGALNLGRISSISTFATLLLGPLLSQETLQARFSVHHLRVSDMARAGVSRNSGSKLPGCPGASSRSGSFFPLLQKSHKSSTPTTCREASTASWSLLPTSLCSLHQGLSTHGENFEAVSGPLFAWGVEHVHGGEKGREVGFLSTFFVDGWSSATALLLEGSRFSGSSCAAPWVCLRPREGAPQTVCRLTSCRRAQ